MRSIRELLGGKDGEVAMGSAGKKKRIERARVLDLVDYLGVRAKTHGIRSVRESAVVTGPDVRITCLISGRWARIGVEVTSYQVDANSPELKARQVYGHFVQVRRSLERRLRCRKNLPPCGGMLVYDERYKGRLPPARDIAAELVQMMLDHHDKLVRGERVPFYRHDNVGGPGELQDFPALRKCFTKVTIAVARPSGIKSNWRYNSAAMVGIVRNVVLNRIAEKRCARPRYMSHGIDETWLLICADGETSHDSAGSEEHSARHLSSASILEAAAGAGFDRVVFWERIHHWHRFLYQSSTLNSHLPD